MPLDNCGGNPWEGCTRGLDCPWWGSSSSADMCNTGSKVSRSVSRYDIKLCTSELCLMREGCRLEYLQ